jgi:hypothetical protein
MVYDYIVRFVGDDITIKVTITEETSDIDHDEIIAKAEKQLCELWGAKEVPNIFIIAEVDVFEVSL